MRQEILGPYLLHIISSEKCLKYPGLLNLLKGENVQCPSKALNCKIYIFYILRQESKIFKASQIRHAECDYLLHYTWWESFSMPAHSPCVCSLTFSQTITYMQLHCIDYREVLYVLILNESKVYKSLPLQLPRKGGQERGMSFRNSFN